MTSYDLRPFVGWIREKFEPSVRVGGRRGSYARSVGDEEMELYGIADMADILYAIGDLHPDEEELGVWRDGFYSLSDPETGYIHEKSFSHGIVHNMAFALGAMHLLGIPVLHPLKFAEAYKSREDMTRFLDEIDWENGVYGGSHGGAGLASILAMVPGTVPPEWFDWYFEYLDGMFDPGSGLMGRNKPPGGDTDQIGGTFHYHFLYEYFHRNMPYPDARVDAVLALQRDCGDWQEGNAWWMTLDALYLLTRTVCDTHYRIDDVRAAVRRMMVLCLERVMDPNLRHEYFGGHFAVHSLNAAVCTFAEAQRFLGSPEVLTELPLQQILDRRPFI